MKKNYEYELYESIVKEFENRGYDVYAEVKDCDVVCIKDKELIIIELKLTLNITVIYQAISRFKYSEHIYIAILRPTKLTLKTYHKMKKLCKMLGVGLILVNLKKNNIDIIIEPTNIHEQKPTEKMKIKTEINNINVSTNIGGINKVKINTAYREKCIYLACILQHHHTLSSKELISLYDLDFNPYSILYNNHYKWFKKYSHGRYTLSNDGYFALDDPNFIKVVNYYTEIVNNKRELMEYKI